MTQLLSADAIIEALDLRPLPVEGGYFAETHRAGTIPHDLLRDTHPGPRSLKTAIYYLLTPQAFSAIHRLPGDEIFHFYLGDAVEQLHLFPDRSGRVVAIGTDLAAGQRPQVVVPGGVWQGARLIGDVRHGYALLGTTMAPGFDVADWVGGDRAALMAAYPAFADLIAALTPAG